MKSAAAGSCCWLAALCSFHTGSAAPAPGYGPTFGEGYLPGMGFWCRGEDGKKDSVLLNYTVTAGSTHGVLHYFWATGPGLIIDRMWVSYYIDGEAEPSIRFQPSMMCGVAFPGLLASEQLFSAGSFCGRSAHVGGFHNSFQIPFQKSILVTMAPDPMDGKCQWGYANVRGTENLPVVLPGSSAPLPSSARLQLHRNDMATRMPREDVVLAKLAPGEAGVVFMTSFGVQAKPVGGVAAGGGYIEGCWRFYGCKDTPFPGVIVGTGVEDYFGSSYYFGIDSNRPAQLFATEQAGLTIFSRDNATGVESVSAYRLHTSDPLFFTDGGQFVWKVGMDNTPGLTKCGQKLKKWDTTGEPGPSPGVADAPPMPFWGQPNRNATAAAAAPASGRTLSAVNVTSYVWVYVWPTATGGQEPSDVNV